MNRDQFIDSQEKLIVVDDLFIFRKGQIFKEKAFDDEYVLLLEVGENLDTGTPSEEPFTIRYITCDAKGVPFLQTWHGTTHSDTWWRKEKLAESYFYTGKVAPEMLMTLCEDPEAFSIRHMTDRRIEIVEKEPKDRRTKEEKQADEDYDKAQRIRAMRMAGISIIKHGGNEEGTAPSDMPSFTILHH